MGKLVVVDLETDGNLRLNPKESPRVLTVGVCQKKAK